jgi:Peptidase family M23
MRATALIASLIALAWAPVALARDRAVPAAGAAGERWVAAGAAGERWVAPVAGGVARGFAVGPDPFARGQHRGADFAAAPASAVRAACGGEVVVAGRVGASGRVVTIRCGPWRVTHQPLAEVAVAAGGRVRRGAAIGTVAPSRAHAGLHLGVRREGHPFGYVDPLPFLGAEAAPSPVVRVPPVGRRSPPPIRPAARSPQPARPAPLTAGRAIAAPASEADRPVAPWPAWAGLGLLLAGAAGAGVRWRPRRHRAPVPRAVAQEVR